MNTESNTDHSLDLPLLLYIIFDEHMGIKWAPEEIHAEKIAKQKMFSFYDKFNFTLFTNAYSLYFKTGDSISNVLNFKQNSLKNYYFPDDQDRKLVNNKVFDILEKKGYQIRIYQSNYIDFCSPDISNIEFCSEYQPNRISDLHNSKFLNIYKMLLIVGHYLKSPPKTQLISYIIKRIRKYFVRPYLSQYLGRIPILSLKIRPPWSTWNNIDIFNQLKEDVNRFPRGRAFFVHLLTPHYPYIYDADGNLIMDPRKWLGPVRWYGTKKDPTYEERYNQYYEQVTSLYKSLDNWFTNLQKMGLLDDAIIIFHGDHGSRIYEKHPDISKVSNPKWDRTLKDGYSTLFAVKGPGLTTEKVDVLKSINELAHDFFLNPHNLKFPSPEKNYVLVPKKGSKELVKYHLSHW